MGGKRRRSAVVSLRDRALAALAIGITVLAALGVFEAADAHSLSDAEAQLGTYRALDTDNLALAAGLNTQNAGLTTYVQALTLDPNTLRGLGGGREALLGDYLSGYGQVADSLARIHEESAQLGIAAQARPVTEAALAWQAWATQRRTTAEAAAGHPADAQQDAEGTALLAAFTAADQNFADQVRRATATAAAAVERQSTRHNQIFYSGLALEALVLLVLAAAVMQSVVRPLGRLTHAAEELAAGQTTRVPYSERLDEVGSLARALAAWQTSSADMVSVFERSPIGICRLSTGGVILEANPSLERMLGYSSGELDGRPYRDLTPETGHYGELVTGRRERVAVETRYQRRDGSHFWGSLTVSPVHHVDGAVDYFVAMIEDIDHRKRQEFDLLHRAGHDALTGLPNRSLFDDRLDQAVRAAHRRRGKLAVLMLDLDRFKPVNDELGHAAGDEVLRRLTDRLGTTLRDSDTLARLGGDEFAILLAEQDEAGAQATALKLLEVMEQPFEIEGQLRPIGLSIGIAVFPADGRNPAELLLAADSAMYRAKRNHSGWAIAQSVLRLA
ncbi:MAG TPA: diguanylate cyclase [Candidatus Dormibacteraeota bacterium]